MKKLFLILFLVLLFLPILQMKFPLIREPDMTENRVPAPWPKLDVRTIREFPRRFEEYLNDNIGFRRLLVRAGNHIKVRVLGMRYISGVIIGRDGWLYLNEGLGSAIEPLAYTQNQLAELVFKKQHMTSQLKPLGATYVEMMIPDKNSVYPQHLPTDANRNIRTTILRQRNEARLLDLFGKTKGAPLYYKTESHWNKYGSYVAYKDLIEQLAVSRPGLVPVRIQNNTTALVPRHGGDLARMITMEDAFTDQEVLFKLDPSSVPESSKLNKIIIYYDSFFDTQYDWSPVPYLRYNFREVMLVKNFIPIDPAFIAKEKPDVVLFEIVERSMDNRQW